MEYVRQHHGRERALSIGRRVCLAVAVVCWRCVLRMVFSLDKHVKTFKGSVVVIPFDGLVNLSIETAAAAAARDGMVQMIVVVWC